MEVEPRSIVLIHSLSHITRAGTAGDIEDLLRASSGIKLVLGQHVQVAPLPPLFLEGCGSPSTIRTCAEITRWCGRIFSDEGLLLTKSFKKAEGFFSIQPGNDG
jgi:hypothetical protein